MEQSAYLGLFFLTWYFIIAVRGVTSMTIHGGSLGNNLSYTRGKHWKQRLFPNPVGRITNTSLCRIPEITSSCSGLME